MANEYVLIQPKGQALGQVSVANSVVDQIARIKVEETKDLALDGRRALVVNNYDTAVALELKVKVKYGKDVEKTCLKLQNELQETIELMLDLKDTVINIEVVGFKFD